MGYCVRPRDAVICFGNGHYLPGSTVPGLRRPCRFSDSVDIGLAGVDEEKRCRRRSAADQIDGDVRNARHQMLVYVCMHKYVAYAHTPYVLYCSYWLVSELALSIGR